MGRFDFELVKYLWMGTSWKILFLHQKNRGDLVFCISMPFFGLPLGTRPSCIAFVARKRTFSVFDFR